MKRIALAVAAVFTAAAPAAFAQYDRYDSYRDSRDNNFQRDREWQHDRELQREDRRGEFGRVIDSRRVYVNSGDAKEECFNARTGYYEEVRNRDTRIGKGAGIGAVAGGVLGHQVDQGGGTAVGAVLGGLLGHHLERRADRNDQPDLDRNRCRVANQGEPAYAVRYEYDGREYTALMNQEPPRRLRVGRDINSDGMPFDNAEGRNLTAYQSMR